MDDIQEQQEIANEISDAISAPMGFGQDIDEDDLLAELEGMEQEDISAQVGMKIMLDLLVQFSIDDTFSNNECRLNVTVSAF